MTETVYSAVECPLGFAVRARFWFRKFREIAPILSFITLSELRNKGFRRLTAIQHSPLKSAPVKKKSVLVVSNLRTICVFSSADFMLSNNADTLITKEYLLPLDDILILGLSRSTVRVMLCGFQRCLVPCVSNKKFNDLLERQLEFDLVRNPQK